MPKDEFGCKNGNITFQFKKYSNKGCFGIMYRYENNLNY